MQWNDKPNAGFSETAPWLPVPPSYKTHNVATESKDPNSILNFYKRVLALRHTNPALLDGKYIALNENDDNVLSYLRAYKNQGVLVALNMSGTPQKLKFDLSSQGFTNTNYKTLLATPDAASAGGEVSLPPFGVFIGEVSK